jgi:hypothetical protein
MTEAGVGRGSPHASCACPPINALFRGGVRGFSVAVLMGSRTWYGMTRLKNFGGDASKYSAGHVTHGNV